MVLAVNQLIGFGVGAAGSSDVVALGGTTANDEVIDPNDASATYTIANTGVESQTTSSSGLFTLGNWVTPTGNAANYECRLTVSSGTFTGSSTGSWLACSSSRSWTVSQTSIGTNSADGTIEIRRASDLVVVATASVVLTAQVNT